MRVRFSTFLLIILTLVADITWAQQVPAGDDQVVKITTKLVQLDAIVTDKDGKQVRDLGMGDFVLLQDGKVQKITGLTYVTTAASQNDTAGSGGSSSGVATTGPQAVRSSGAPVGRLITFVVDDGNCSVSQIGMEASREGLKKFVNEQMLPEDRVAIYQTRSGSSMMQQYTSDKKLLLKAAGKIRWYPPPLGCAGPIDGSFYNAAKPNIYDKLSVDPTRANEVKTIESAAEQRIREGNEDFMRNNQVVGTIGVLRYIVRGLERVPGRKVLFFMSDGLQIRGRDAARSLLTARDALGELTDQANRASVVFNTIDVRGLFDPSMIEARDRVLTRDDARASEPVVGVRQAIVRDSREGMSFLANETGGQFYYDQNYIDNPVRKALSIETGYYLISYEPDEDTFKSKDFNQIEIRVNRPGLTIYSRAGFVSSTETRNIQKRRTENSDLYEALIAPLPRAGIDMRLTAFFGNGASEGNYVRSITHLNGNDITFVKDGDNIKATFDVAAVTLNEKNDVVDEFTRAHTFRIDAAAMPMIKRSGIVYTTDVPIKKPGTYNFRLAVRDANSRLLGSASQVIEIPDLKKGRLALSALTVDLVDAKGKFNPPASVKPENALAMVMSDSVPAIRRFARGAVLAYAYTVYNARLDRNKNRPSLTVQVKLYRDGKLMTAFDPVPADLAPHSDWSRINDFGYLRLGPEMDKGDYALEITVTDLLAPNSARTASQWVDFEIVN